MVGPAPATLLPGAPGFSPHSQCGLSDPRAPAPCSHLGTFNKLDARAPPSQLSPNLTEASGISVWRSSLVMPLCSQLLLLVVQLLSRVRFSATPRTAALQASLSFAISWSLLKILSIDSMMPSNQLVLCQPRQEFLLQEKSKNLLWWFTGSQCPHSIPGSGFVPAQLGSQSSPLRRASGQGTGGQVVTCWSTDPAEQVWGGRPPGLQVLGATLPQDEVRIGRA